MSGTLKAIRSDCVLDLGEEGGGLVGVGRWGVGRGVQSNLKPMTWLAEAEGPT